MKVFGSFTRKCYQSLLNFLTKSITPIIDLYDNDYEYAKLYQKTEYLEKHSEGLLNKKEEKKTGLAEINKKLIQENDKQSKFVHILQIAWELEETFNCSFTHSQYVLNSLNGQNNNSSLNFKNSSLVESEYPSFNNILKDEVEDQKSEEIENDRINEKQHIPKSRL